MLSSGLLTFKEMGSPRDGNNKHEAKSKVRREKYCFKGTNFRGFRSSSRPRNLILL